MSYQLRDSRKKDKGILKTVVVCVALYLIYALMGTMITNTLHSVQRGVGTFFGYYEDPIRPISENSLIKELKSENTQLKFLLGRADHVEGIQGAFTASATASTTVGTGTSTVLMDKTLKIIDVKKQNSPDSTLVLGVILSRPPRTPYDSLIIDIGEDEGLMQGDLVYADRDYIIGEVSEVYDATSVIRLYSSPDQKIDVLIGSSTTPVIALGRGGGNFYIKIPKNIVIHEGDQIVAPGIRGRILGTAERVDTDEGEAYSHIYFKLPVNIYSLHYVQIKKNIR